jgi:hypothetical protein
MGPAAIQARTRRPGSILSTRLSKSASQPARCARLPASSSRDHSDRWTAQPIWAGGRTHVAFGRTFGAFGRTHAAGSCLFVQCVAAFVHKSNVSLHLCPLVLTLSPGRRTPLARLSPAAAPGGRRWSGWSRSSRIRRTTTSPPGCSTGARRQLLLRRPEPARGVFWAARRAASRFYKRPSSPPPFKPAHDWPAIMDRAVRGTVVSRPL